MHVYILYLNVKGWINLLAMSGRCSRNVYVW